ncbi:hypothetical protein B0T22DRAFT_313604 [Podospora appendiculata]|uniref:Uncharacterized protein n=1 Tax=Podospora appendiculata TaxID=314037 RepID=A0AAE0WYN7_9PEZI|nr:hypothetical protein B0T22DRAFT_313604 [Podospora appendiculata]
MTWLSMRGTADLRHMRLGACEEQSGQSKQGMYTVETWGTIKPQSTPVLLEPRAPARGACVVWCAVGGGQMSWDPVLEMCKGLIRVVFFSSAQRNARRRKRVVRIGRAQDRMAGGLLGSATGGRGGATANSWLGRQVVCCLASGFCSDPRNEDDDETVGEALGQSLNWRRQGSSRKLAAGRQVPQLDGLERKESHKGQNEKEGIKVCTPVHTCAW